MSTPKKAKAPRPGVGKRITAAEAASKVITITMNDGKVYRLAPAAIRARDRLALIDGLGKSWEWILGGRTVEGADGKPEMIQTEDIDPVASTFAIWWLARRASGEPDLSFDQADEEFVTAIYEIKDVDTSDATGLDPEA